MSLKFKNRPSVAGIIFMLACILFIIALAAYSTHKKNAASNSEAKYVAATDDIPLPYWLSSQPEMAVDKSKGDRREVTVSALAHPSDLLKTQEYYRQSLLEFGWTQALDQKDIQTFVKVDETLSILYIANDSGKLIVRYEVAPTSSELGADKEEAQ
jgi:hypothetical protein